MKKFAIIGAVALSTILLAGCTSPTVVEEEVKTEAWKTAADSLFSYSDSVNTSIGAQGVVAEANLVTLEEKTTVDICEAGQSYWDALWIIPKEGISISVEELTKNLGEDSTAVANARPDGATFEVYDKEGNKLVIDPQGEENVNITGKSACFTAGDAPKKLLQLGGGKWEEVKG